MAYKNFLSDKGSYGAFVEKIHLGRCGMAESPYHTCRRCETGPANDACPDAPWRGIVYHDGQAYDAHTSLSGVDRVIWFRGDELSEDEEKEYVIKHKAFVLAAARMFRGE